jgi:uncharacterized protein (TIGR02996 family)
VAVSTDEEALLAAIAAAPRDDAPRLVYADWLQERGQDAKAEYLRTVVTLMHPPENVADVARCRALAEDLDPDWRQQVGGRFEVMLDGAASLLLVAFVVQSLLKIAFHEAVNLWHSGQPVRLKSMITREDAEALVQTFSGNMSDPSSEDGRPLRLFVRPMEDDAALGLFAPLSSRKST